MVRRVRWIWLIVWASAVGNWMPADERALGNARENAGRGAASVGSQWVREDGWWERMGVNELLGWVGDQVRGDYEVDLGVAKGTVRLLARVLHGAEETRGYGTLLETWQASWPEQVEFRVGAGAWESGDEGIPGVEPARTDEVPGLAVEAHGAEHYVEQLKPIFESLAVPAELVWVAEVESAFNPRAVSPVGAAGLYQLMPATARQYGLMLEPEDDRFHPEKNARAAARHMSYLRREFDDWALAMAAYNAGHNRVRGLLDKHHARSFEEIADYLPAETRQYVPKVDATLARRAGVTLAGLPARREPGREHR